MRDLILLGKIFMGSLQICMVVYVKNDRISANIVQRIVQNRVMCYEPL